VHLLLWLPLTIAGMIYFLLPSARPPSDQGSSARVANKDPV